MNFENRNIKEEICASIVAELISDNNEETFNYFYKIILEKYKELDNKDLLTIMNKFL